MLLEREAELSLLASIVGNLDGTRGRVVLVRGEAGIGKSALVAEFVSRHEQSTHVLFGACDDLLTPQTLGAFWDIARDESTIRDALLEDDRRRLQADLLDLLSRSLRPTILVVEDTQWADEATLDVVKFLGRRIGRTNGLLLLTYRDTEVDADHPLRQVIGDLPASDVRRMPLLPLSSTGIATMMESKDFDVADVLAQTDGNPLYVTELLASGPGHVPASIQDIVLSRATRLSDDARQLLEAASVVPGSAERSLIASLIGQEFAGLDEAERSGFVRSSADTIGFVHELQRRAIEDSIPPDRRRELNNQVLGLLGPDADASRLVHHAREANNVDALVEFAPIAARAAVAAGSARQAVAHFRLLDPYIDEMAPAVATAILQDWARQELYLHEPAAVELTNRAIRASSGLDDPVVRGTVLAFSARVNMQHLRTEDAFERATEAVELLEEAGDASALAFALSILAHVGWLRDEDVPASLELAGRALSVAEASGDTAMVVRALTVTANLESSIGIAGGMERLEAARSLASTSGDREAEVRALSNMTAMAADFRHMALASDLARRAIETASRYEIPSVETETRAMYSEILMWSGDWVAAENAATDALGTHPGAETIAWRVLGTLQARRGRIEARAALDRMWSQADDVGQLSVVDPAAGALAEYMWLTGDYNADWLERLDVVLAEGIQVGNPWPSGAFAFWMWKLERLDSAPEGTLDMYGWIIDGDLDPAIAFWSERAIPYEHSLALMHGTPEQQLKALRIAEDLGAKALARKIRVELTAAGHPPPRGQARATRVHAAGLTTRQDEVLGLLDAGMSNAEIADELFLSPRTVENHVAAVLMKLDAPNRDTAVAIAKDQGIL